MTPLLIQYHLQHLKHQGLEVRLLTQKGTLPYYTAFWDISTGTTIKGTCFSSQKTVGQKFSLIGFLYAKTNES